MPILNEFSLLFIKPPIKKTIKSIIATLRFRIVKKDSNIEMKYPNSLYALNFVL